MDLVRTCCCLDSIEPDPDHPFKEDYKWKEMIGKGSFGEIFRCMRKSDKQIMACKIMSSKDEGVKQYIRMEIHIMQKLSQKHPAFLTFYDWRRKADTYYIFTEICEGGDLLGYGKMTNKEFKVIVEQITSALQFLHSRRIVHLDLKPVTNLIQLTQKLLDQ